MDFSAGGNRTERGNERLGSTGPKVPWKSRFQPLQVGQLSIGNALSVGQHRTKGKSVEKKKLEK